VRRGALTIDGHRIEANARADVVERVTDQIAAHIVGMRESCSLDIADRERDGSTLEEVGDVFKRTRERARQLERRALKRLEQPARLKGLDDA
jgi:DNA-directed RNA polymerase sigma subunit (sigma70/sigma32)